MRMKVRWIALAFLAQGAMGAQEPADARPAARSGREGARTYPPEMPGARSEIYKTVGDTKLSLFIFAPEGPAPTHGRPGIIFFFGGGWVSGSPVQFLHSCRYLASRGMVAMAADYRVASRHEVKPVQCVADAKSAVRWIRSHAGRLGVDPQRLCAAGGSAGGHLAAATAFVPGFDEKGEELAVSCVPNALVLFNPGLVFAPLDGRTFGGFGYEQAEERLGARPESISPGHHVSSNAPPPIIFHGKADTTVPYESVECFAAKSTRLGNRCELVGYDGQKHGFFNYRNGPAEPFRDTLRRTDEFLASLGWLKGAPNVEEFFREANKP